MHNQTNPECRDAFIEAMEADGGDYDLTWYSLVPTDVNSEWRWADGMTQQLYRDGFCLAYKPPRDVDPESVLGKLHDDVKNGIGTIAVLVSMDDAAAIIHLIESQAARIEELDESVDAFIRRDKTQCDEISRMRMEAEQ